MVLKYDMKSKEERVKREEQHENERNSARGSIGLKFRNRAYEKRVTKAVKHADSTINIEEFIHCRSGEKWKHTDLSARDSFSKNTESKGNIQQV